MENKMNFKELFGIASEAVRDSYDREIFDMRLEQVEKDGDDHLVVVSFVIEDKMKDESLIPITGKFDRIYKQIRIDKNNHAIEIYIFSVS
jgi:carbonic anhydrase